jgi:hypothetical protein
MKQAGSLIGPIIDDLGIREGVKLAEIKKNWHSLFQKPVSFHTSPSKLTDGELLLNVDSPVWLQQLNFFKADIIQKLGAFGITSVRLRLGRVSLKGHSEGPPVRSKPVSAEARAYIEKTVSAVDDEALKAAMKKAMEKAISSGKTKIS